MKTPQRTRTPIRTKVVEVHFCEVCGRRLANVELITTGTKLCSDCDKLTSIRRPSSRRSSRRMLRYETRFWLVMGLVALTFVLLIAAILIPARSSRVAEIELNATDRIPASTMAQLQPERPKPITAPIPSAPVAKVEHAVPTPAPTKRRNPDAPDTQPPAPTPPATPPATPPTTAPKPAVAQKDHNEPNVSDLLNTPQTAHKANTDEAGSAENKPATAAAQPESAPANPAPAAPKTAASAASAAPAVQPASAAEAPKTAEDFEPFDAARKKAYARVCDGDAFAARRILEQQRKNPALEDPTATIDDELALIDDVERVQKALPAGFKQLDSRKISTLHLTDGHSVTLGEHCRITTVKDGMLEIEETAEGASLTRKLNFTQLTPQTRYDVAAQGLAGPSGSLSLAGTAYVFLRTGTGAIPFGDFKARIDAARKDGSLTERADHLLELYTTAQKDAAIDAAMKRINEAIKGKLPGLARNLLRDFKKDYATGDVPPRIQEFLDKATFELAEVKQGLWASFYSGTEENPLQKYLFSREETKLFYSWGQGSPDPKVPNDCFGIRFHGLLRVTTPGTYVFWVSADDMLELTIDGKHVVAANWVPDAEAGKTGSIKLATGDHDLTVTFKELFVDAMMHVKWRQDADKTFQEIPENALWYDPKLVEKYQKDVN